MRCSADRLGPRCPRSQGRRLQIAYVFDLPIRGLLATSGAIAIILGLALQSTLSDVIDGLVRIGQMGASLGEVR